MFTRISLEVSGTILPMSVCCDSHIPAPAREENNKKGSLPSPERELSSLRPHVFTSGRPYSTWRQTNLAFYPKKFLPVAFQKARRSDLGPKVVISTRPSVIQCANITLSIAIVFSIVAFSFFLKYATFDAPAKACVYHSEGDLLICT